MSSPTSPITAMASGRTRPFGSVPAERARHPGGGAALKSASAIWERAEVPIQTKRTIGTDHPRLLPPSAAGAADPPAGKAPPPARRIAQRDLTMEACDGAAVAPPWGDLLRPV